MAVSKSREAKAPRNLRKAAQATLALTLVAGMCVPFAGSAFAEGEEGVAPLAETAECAEPTFEGYSTVVKYLEGGSLTLEELAQVDFAALAAWDAQVAQDLRALRDALEAEATTPEAPDVSLEGEEPGLTEATAPEGAVEGTESAEEAPVLVPDEVPVSEDPFDATQEYPEWSYNGDTSFTMVHYTQDMDAQKLIAAIGEPARLVAQEQGVSASEMIALAVIKSDSGRSVAAQAPTHNLFRTIDASDGQGGLASYDTYGECLADHAARVVAGAEAAVPEDAAWAGSFATLAERVQAVVDDYDLTRYDVPLRYQPAEPLTVSAWDEAADAWADRPVELADVVDEAISHLGTPYVWGGATTEGFDCSGLVQYSYAHALGIELPRTSYYQCTVGQDVDFADLHIGDLLFFAKEGVVGHVAMYVGEGCYIEAPEPGMEVKLTAMDEKVPTFAKRIVATVPVPEGDAEAATDEGAAALTPEEEARQTEQEIAARTYALWKEQLA